jgi:hypothetical protein
MSISYPDKTYIGYTCDLKQRFVDHTISFVLVECGIYDGIDPEHLNINLPTPH